MSITIVLSTIYRVPSMSHPFNLLQILSHLDLENILEIKYCLHLYVTNEETMKVKLFAEGCTTSKTAVRI